MEQTGLHPELDLRLMVLKGRIDALRQRLGSAAAHDKVHDVAELAALEHRYKTLEEKTHALNLQGPGFRHAIKAEILMIADDLTSVTEAFAARLGVDDTTR